MCAPSQYGLLRDAPHRQRNVVSAKAERPFVPMTVSGPVSISGPLGRTRIWRRPPAVAAAGSFGRAQRAVVREADLRVAAVAERLVLRLAAATKRDSRVGKRDARVLPHHRKIAAQVRRAAGRQRGGVPLGDRLGNAIRALDVQRAARATLDDAGQSARCRTIRVDPGSRLRVEHRRQAPRALAGVDAALHVVGDGSRPRPSYRRSVACWLMAFIASQTVVSDESDSG